MPRAISDGCGANLRSSLFASRLALQPDFSFQLLNLFLGRRKIIMNSRTVIRALCVAGVVFALSAGNFAYATGGAHDSSRASARSGATARNRIGNSAPRRASSTTRGRRTARRQPDNGCHCPAGKTSRTTRSPRAATTAASPFTNCLGTCVGSAGAGVISTLICGGLCAARQVVACAVCLGAHVSVVAFCFMLCDANTYAPEESAQ